MQLLEMVSHARGMWSRNKSLCGLHGPYYCLQWEDFLKLGDEIETSVVEEKIKAQKPEQCALLIYTVS